MPKGKISNGGKWLSLYGNREGTYMAYMVLYEEGT